MADDLGEELVLPLALVLAGLLVGGEGVGGRGVAEVRVSFGVVRREFAGHLPPPRSPHGVEPASGCHLHADDGTGSANVAQLQVRTRRNGGHHHLGYDLCGIPLRLTRGRLGDNRGGWGLGRARFFGGAWSRRRRPAPPRGARGQGGLRHVRCPDGERVSARRRTAQSGATAPLGRSYRPAHGQVRRKPAPPLRMDRHHLNHDITRSNACRTSAVRLPAIVIKTVSPSHSLVDMMAPWRTAWRFVPVPEHHERPEADAGYGVSHGKPPSPCPAPPGAAIPARNLPLF